MVRVNFAFALVALLRVATAQTTTQEPLIVPEDTIAVNDANAAILERCEGGFKGDLDREDERKALLDGVGSDNIIMQILTKAKDQDDLQTVAQEELTPMWLFFKAAPLLMTFLLIIVWAICCWTACPLKYFCKCCRCCSKERPSSRMVKFIALAILGAQIWGIIIAASMAFEGYNKATDGFANLGCTSAKMLNTTLQGKAHPFFLGFLPMLEKFDSLADNFLNDSAFLVEVDASLSNTKAINDAVAVAAGTLTVLKDMMNLQANVRPTYNGADLMHNCSFCLELAHGALQPAIDALDGGIGTALAGARSEVDAQLTYPKRMELRKTIKDASAPLAELKNSVRDTFTFFISDDFEQFAEHIDGTQPTLQIALSIIIVMAFLLATCGTFSLGCCIFREKTSSLAAQGKNPYNPWIHRCSCCTWCCGFFYAMLAFFVGGLMVVIVVPTSGICLIMDDMDSAMLESMAPALGLNMTGDDGVMMADMVDTCFNPVDPYGPTNMMDIFFTVNDTGHKETMRDVVVKQTKDAVDTAFQSIDTKSGDDPSLSGSTSITTLRSVISGNPVDAMLVAIPTMMQSDPNLADMTKDSRGGSGISLGFSASAACADHTVTAGMGSMSGTVVKGVDSFETALGFYGSLNNDGSGSCAQTSTCNNTPSADASSACAAANKYIQKKRELMDQATFRCDLFFMPGSATTECDPDTSLTPTTCLWADGTMHVKQKTCTLAQFTAYVRRFDQRIDRVFTNLDASVSATQSAISTDMRATMTTYMLDPIEEIADGMTCGFIALLYQEMIDALCYQGVSGLRDISRSYVGCAIVSLTMIMLMYAVWRRSIDNGNHWERTEVVEVGGETGKDDEESGHKSSLRAAANP
mmetsp:Transcript_86123/g.184484  ORF Transcript_86123/g.184484 Transcript_86123/m.184484 type:complete len:866 (+) Transcript_86123:181-2778(+)